MVKPHQQLWEAKRLARENNCYVVDKPSEKKPGVTEYVLYRQLPGRDRGARIGKRSTPGGLLELVKSATSNKPASIDNERAAA